MIITNSLLNRKKCSRFLPASAGIEAEEGTILHYLLASLPIPELNGVLGSEYRGEFRPFRFHHNFQELEAVALEIKEKNPDLFEKKWEQEKELKADLNFGIYSYKLSGIMDLLKIDGNTAYIADWKTGRTEVDITSLESSSQAVFYAYLVLSQEFLNYPDVDTVSFTYVYTKSNTRKEIRFTKADLDTLRFYILIRIITTEEAGMKSGNHCTYCQNLSSCPLMLELIDRFESGDDKQDYKELKLLEKLVAAKIEKKKKELEAVPELWHTVRTYYVYPETLTAEQKALLEKKEKEKIRVSSAIARKLKEAGAVVEESGYKKFKG